MILDVSDPYHNLISISIKKLFRNIITNNYHNNRTVPPTDYTLVIELFWLLIEEL